MYKFTKIYSDSNPVLEEGDIFKTTIPLIADGVSDVTKEDSDTTEDKILKLIKNNKTISAAQIQKELGFKSRTSVQRILTKMLSDSKIKKSGTGKNTVYYFEE